MPTLPPTNRARIVMDLIKDDEVTTLANYADDKVDYLDGATSLKWASYIWDAYGPPQVTDGEGNTGPAPKTNDNMSRFLTQKIRDFFDRAAQVGRRKQVVEAARAAEQAAIDTEALADLGADEEMEADE
jgi:hypothetical protein